LVQNGPDDLFLVGDPHQRIYDNHVSLAKLAINVRGRSRRLTVNYRTTRDGIEPHAIGVAARAGYLWKAASDALRAAGIPVAKLSASAKTNGVRLGSMHGMKGLEFQAVAVIGVSDGVVPAPNAVTPESADPLAHAQDLQRARCLLFVACTRARDHLYVSYSGTPSPFLG
jgi:superfamily I DNA/RNA helicase